MGPFRDIEQPGAGVLIGADIPQLHLTHDIRVGNFDAPVAVKTTLWWVLVENALIHRTSFQQINWTSTTMMALTKN